MKIIPTKFELLTKPYPIGRIKMDRYSVRNFAKSNPYYVTRANIVYFAAVAKTQFHKSGKSIVIFGDNMITVFKENSEAVKMKWDFVDLNNLHPNVKQKEWKEEINIINKTGYAKITY